MSGVPAGPFGLTLLVTAAALLVMMAVTFAVALRVGRHSVVDTAWGLGIALAPPAMRALVAFLPHDLAANALRPSLSLRLLVFAFVTSLAAGLASQARSLTQGVVLACDGDIAAVERLRQAL